MQKTRPRRALLISTIHEPIAFVTYRRIYSLIRREVVEVLSEWDGEKIVHDVNMPAILQLKNFVLSRTAHKMCTYNRGVVLARDGYTCQYCNRRLALREATMDQLRRLLQVVQPPEGQPHPGRGWHALDASAWPSVRHAFLDG